MLRNFFKIAIRSFIRRKSFTWINIIGLAIGMAASILIAMWVYDEITYDTFHQDAERIHRLERDIFYQGNQVIVPVTGARYAYTMKEEIPGIEDVCRLYPITLSLKDRTDVFHTERVFYADSSFFKVFSFTLKQGNPDKALTEPYSILLNEKAAKKYFGSKNPMNEKIELDWNGETHHYIVRGVFDEPEGNSHLNFEMVASFNTLEPLRRNQFRNWLNNYLYTYVKLDEHTTAAQAEENLVPFASKYLQRLKQLIGIKGELSEVFRLRLKPVEDIYLHTDGQWDIGKNGSMTSVVIFSIVAVLILLIASFNFMNLSTALAEKRALEVGLRKTIGAHKKNLVAQFLGESVFLTILAFVFSAAIIQAALPSFNHFVDKDLSWAMFLEPAPVIAVIIIVLGTGFFAGLYPAFYLSSISPIKALKKEKVTAGKGISFRQVLVTLQFFITISLIIATITAIQQLNFMQSKSLGFNKENIVFIPFESNQVDSEYETFKGELLKNPVIEAVTASGSIPMGDSFSDTGFETELSEQPFLSTFMPVHDDFFEVWGLELLAGRKFHAGSDNEAMRSYIINETAMKDLGIPAPEDAIGIEYNMMGGDTTFKGKVVGVVKDFHIRSLRKKMEPVSIFYRPDYKDGISIRVTEGSMSKALPYIAEKWQEQFPGVFYNYEIISERFERKYASERRMKNILMSFTFLTFFIALLGLLGLAAFLARQKSKEIAIRKVLGAEVSTIIKLLTSQFNKWVVISIIISWPVTYYFLDRWLSSFAYRITPDWWVFMLSGLVALIIATITVSMQTYKAATANPVEAIKYE